MFTLETLQVFSLMFNGRNGASFLF